jgi:glycosyltransferase involved in cell wall biosynthesis
MPSAAPTRPELLVFTESYPYEAALENTFIEPELPHLLERFSKVTVIPWRRGGLMATPPAAVRIEDGLWRHLERQRSPWRLVVSAIASSAFWLELLKRPRTVVQPAAMRRLIFTVGMAELARAWIGPVLRRSPLGMPCVAYTFWCDHITLALAMERQDRSGLRVVSKAHGADLYAERHIPPYIPARDRTFRGLDRLFPDSHRGADYIRARYPWFASKCEAALMGVEDPGFVALPSSRNECVVASCSRLVPVKRVDLIVAAVAEAGRARPDARFEWHHFGDGELRPDVERALTTLPPNASGVLHGYPSHSALMDFYREHPVDVFVNASESEGTSVAVMEAIACGIPVVATAVGGNVEIVDASNGVLTSPDPSVDELARAILNFAGDASHVAALRTASRAKWSASYDATANYRAFAHRLAALTRVEGD